MPYGATRRCPERIAAVIGSESAPGERRRPLRASARRRRSRGGSQNFPGAPESGHSSTFRAVRRELVNPPRERRRRALARRDGAVRRVRFLEPMTAAILSGHRRVAPYGMAGGSSGETGRNAVLSRRRQDRGVGRM